MSLNLLPTSLRLLALMLAAALSLASRAIAQPEELKGAKHSPLERLPSFEVQPTWTAPADLAFVDITKAWPARVARAGARGVIREFDGPIHTWRSDRWFFQKATLDPEDREDIAAWENIGGPVAGAEMELERVGSFIVGFSEARRRFGTTAPMDVALRGYRFISAERVAASHEGDPDRLLLSRTSFVMYDPLGAGSARDHAVAMPPDQWKGFAVLMPGIFGTPDPVLDAMTRHLRQKGYWVLRMLAQSSRFTEHLEISIDPDGQMEDAAELAASTLGDRAAECAYAVQAVAEHVLAQEPALTKLPRVIVGGSGGAISLPTVVALEPSKYKAAIMIAGGVDYWLINLRSNYARGVGAIIANWTRPPTDEEQRRFDRAYLAHAPLDGFNTVGAMRTMPVFTYYGSVDLAVQSTLADLAWERLGRPDRKVVPLGHEWLFGTLGGSFTDMTDWLDRAIATGGRVPANVIEGSVGPSNVLNSGAGGEVKP